MTELVLQCPQCGRSGDDLELIDHVPSRWPRSTSSVYRCTCGWEFIQTVFAQADGREHPRLIHPPAK